MSDLINIGKKYPTSKNITGFLEIYDNLPSEVEVQSGLNHSVIRLRTNETVVNQYLLDCRLRGQFRLGNPRLRSYNPSFLFYYESEIEST